LQEDGVQQLHQEFIEIPEDNKACHMQGLLERLEEEVCIQEQQVRSNRGKSRGMILISLLFAIIAEVHA
jgi:hypothetical protein